MNFILSLLILTSPLILVSHAARRSTGRVLKRHNRLSHPKRQFPAHIGHKSLFVESRNGQGIPYHESVYGYGIRLPDKYPRFNYSALQYRLRHRTGLTHYVKPDGFHRAPYMSHIYGYGVPYHHHHRTDYNHKPQPSYNATAIVEICNDPHKRHSFDRLGIDLCKFNHNRKQHHDSPPNLHSACNDANQRKLFDRLGIDICKELALPHQTPSTGRDKIPLNDKPLPNPTTILDSYCKDSHHHELFDKHRINICEDYIRPHSDPITVLKSYCENEQQLDLINKLGINICKDYEHYVRPLFDKPAHHNRGDALESACKHSHQRDLFHKLGITICDELEIPQNADKSHHNPQHNPGVTLDSACKDAVQRQKFDKLCINICKDFVEPPHSVEAPVIPSKPGSYCDDPRRRQLFDRLRINVCKISGLPGFDKNDGYRAPYRSNIFGFNMRANAKLYDKARTLVETYKIANLDDTTTTTTTTSKPVDPCSDEHQRQLFIRLGITICN